MEFINFIFQSYTVPEDQSEFDGIIKTVIQKAESGGILAVHCLAGIGRTGLVLAAIAKRHLGLDGEGAIRWVRCFVPGAIENQTQEDFIRKYQVSFNTNN